MKRRSTIAGHYNIDQFAAFLVASETLPSCSERTAWKWIDKHRRIMRPEKRSGIVFVKVDRAVHLSKKILTGKATL